MKKYFRSKKTWDNLKEFNIDLYNILDKTIPIEEAIYLYQNNIKKPLCGCGEYTKFKGLSKGYTKYCSNKCSANSDDTRLKREETNLLIYGDVCNMRNVDIKQKQISNRPDIRIFDNFKNRCLKYLKLGYVYNEDLGNDYVSLTDQNTCKHTFVIQQLLFRRRVQYGKTICTICNNFKNGISEQEKELKSFLDSINIKYDSNTKILNSNKELDVYIPSINVAIEYNGSFWHSIRFKSKHKYYHFDKSLECFKQGICLIHIWEDEWIFRKEETKQKILDIINGEPKIIKDVYNFDSPYRFINREANYEKIEPVLVIRKDNTNIDHITWSCGGLYL